MSSVLNDRIKVYLLNRTTKTIELSDYSTINEELFSGRSDIVKVVLPEGVKAIGNNAFENCINLEEIELPNSLESLGSEAFINCTNLKKAEYGQNVSVNDTAFKGCALLK